MHTSRDDDESRQFLKDELLEHGRLRQSWGYCDSQDLREVLMSWGERTPRQKERAVIAEWPMRRTAKPRST